MDWNISHNETISRYIVSESAIKSSTNTVKYSLYMPMYNSEGECWETSVFRINDLREEDIWQIGDEYVAEPRNKPLIGRSELEVRQVENIGDLSVKSTEPPERHAVIVEWPTQREDIIELAKELAKAAGTVKIR